MFLSLNTGKHRQKILKVDFVVEPERNEKHHHDHDYEYANYSFALG
jgi:hypothetical protein